MGFHQARAGKGPRFARGGSAALCGSLISVGIAYSQIFYPAVRKDLVQSAVAQPNQTASMQFDCTRDHVLMIDDAPIRVRRVRGESGTEADARMLWAVRFLMGIAKGSADE